MLSGVSLYNPIACAGNAEDVVLMRAFADRPGGFFVDVGRASRVGRPRITA